jgi:hypothetical protein
MSCTCSIESWECDQSWEYVSLRIYEAKKEHQCGECARKIKPGEKYEYVHGKFDQYLQTHKTCCDCLSIRDQLFCTWIYGEIWQDLNETFSNDPEPPSSECMMKMTKRGRDMICDLLEEIWDDE